MQGVAVVRFTRELSLWDPETFVRTVLVEWLHVAEVWVGANFLFGHERAGTFTRSAQPRRPLRVPRREDRSCPLQGLRRQQHAHSAAACRKGAWTRRARCSDITISSTASSRAAPAAAAEIGFPTANLDTANELLPPAGVYATTHRRSTASCCRRSPMSACGRRSATSTG